MHGDEINNNKTKKTKKEYSGTWEFPQEPQIGGQTAEPTPAKKVASILSNMGVARKKHFCATSVEKIN